MEYSLKNIWLLIILSLLLINFRTKHISSDLKEIEIESKLDSILTSLHQNGKFNGNVLVAKNDKIIFKKGFGFSRGNKQTLLKTTDKFNIGSIYKEIPAIAIMQLEEKELIELNDPIKKHLKNLPDWSNHITILNLLQYSSGLPKIDWRKHQEINGEALMNDLLEISNLNSIPGESYLYTNYSPFLLSKIVENISRTSFQEYAYQNILKPFELNNSGFNKLFPYENTDSMSVSFNSDFVEDSPPFVIKSSIFLFSTTIEDMYKLLKNLHSHNIISNNSLNIIGKTADLNIENMESALGQVQFKNNKITKHNHHGSSGNYECLINRNNLNKSSIIIFTNNKNDNTHSIKNSILDLLK